MNNHSTDDNKIKVIVRIKGKTDEDTEEQSKKIKLIDNKTIFLESKEKRFVFDYIGTETCTQNDIFENCGKKICDDSLKGYNGTIFAYGQTGSGKTYTILGKNILKRIEPKISNNTSFISDLDDIEMNNMNRNIYEYDVKDERIGLLPRILYYLFQQKQKDGQLNMHIIQ